MMHVASPPAAFERDLGDVRSTGFVDLGRDCGKSTIAVIAVHHDLRSKIRLACDMIGATVCAVSDDGELAEIYTAGSLDLALVSMADLAWSPQALLAALRHRGAPRTVLVGPSFASTAHLMALEIGFDEVWPAGAPTTTLAALIRAQVRGKNGRGSASGRPMPQRLDIRVDLEGSSCSSGGRFVTFSRSHLEILDLLLRRAPAVVPRIEIRSLIPEVRSERRTNSRVVDTVMSQLRRSFRAQEVLADIVCTRGIGYRIAGSIHG